MSSIKEIFQNNVNQYHDDHIVLAKKDKNLSVLRLTLFVISMALVVYASNDRNGLFLSIVVFSFFLLFGLLVRHHNKIKFKNKTAFFLKKLNEEELQRSEGKFQDLKKGDEFFDKNHSYAPDLDIFGSNSLFQLILRSRLLQTQKLAAQWMLDKADKNVIIQRQEALKELSEKVEFRQHFTTYGMHAESSQTEDQISSFEVWMSDRNAFVEKPIWKILNWIMPVLSIIAIVGILIFSLPYQVIFIPIILNAIVLKFTFEPLLKLTEDFDKATKSLKMYEYLFASIENTDFKSERLNALKHELSTENTNASKAVGSLRRILDQLQNRSNMLYLPINILFVLDLFWLRKAENWKRFHGQNAEDWFATVHEFDLLNDMASFAFANQHYAFPEILDEKFVINAERLGHPLIHQDNRISNTFEFRNSGFVGLITGSNMSGKSTFLRTVGLNLVMAQMGLPVCSKSFSFSLTRVFTGMRTIDNLEESVSSFYAELARIKSLLDNINDEEPMFYLLDEILKGTNSEDRHKGSISLIQQLNKKNAFGLISTHDLTLSSLEKRDGSVKNYSFNSAIEDDEILFDYKLTDGPCKSFNASKLMEKMGIIVEEE